MAVNPLRFETVRCPVDDDSWLLPLSDDSNSNISVLIVLLCGTSGVIPEVSRTCRAVCPSHSIVDDTIVPVVLCVASTV